jgi:uncharacterized membrane protein YqjE
MNQKHPEHRRTGERPPGEGTRVSDVAPTRLSTTELVARIARDAQSLVKAEIQLARTELRADLQKVASSIRRLGAAIALGSAGAAMALVTVVLVLALFMPAWAAALIVTLALLVGAGASAALAWKARVRAPLERTRQNLKEDLQWTKARQRAAS